jgi:hypothetical protein
VKTPAPLFGTLAGLVLLAGPSAFAADDFISFKKRAEAEKKFVARVGTAIVKAARSKPQKVELEKFRYTHPNAGRTNLEITMSYTGLLTRRKYAAEIVVRLDSGNKDGWEVLNIKYTDDNPSLVGPSERKIQDLIKVLNK